MSKQVNISGSILPIEELHLNFLMYALRNKFGFLESSKNDIPVDGDGSVMPLYTYPCYEWINSMDWDGADIFEFGCGFSSIFWKEKNANVYGVDNDMEWVNRVNNGTIYESDLKKYPNVINNFDKKFDVIIIDGVARYDCVLPSIPKLKSGGMIILDNSDWHKNVKELLDNENLIPIHFHGFKPIHVDSETTSCYLHREFSRVSKSIIPMGGTVRKPHETNFTVK